MAITLPAQITRDQQTADGILTKFPYTWKMFEADNADVYVTLFGNSPNDVADLKELGIDYNVSGVGNTDGGTIDFIAGKIPPNLSTVTSDRNIPASITSEFSNAQTFNGANLDNQLERIVALIQQNKTSLDFNSIKYVINAILSSDQIANVPTLANNEIWKGTASGSVGAFILDETPSCSTLRSELANKSAGTDGARLVGYNDLTLAQVTVKAALDTQQTSINTNVTNIANLDIEAKLDKFYTTTGTADAIILTTIGALPITGYNIGLRVSFRVIADNTAAVTIDIDEVGTKDLVSYDDKPMTASEIIVTNTIEAVYDGTKFVAINTQFRPVNIIKLSGDQVVPINTQAKVVFNTAEINDRTYFNLSTNEFIPTVAGFYKITIQLRLSTGGATVVGFLLDGAGTEIARASFLSTNSDQALISFSVFLNGSGDTTNRVLGARVYPEKLPNGFFRD